MRIVGISVVVASLLSSCMTKDSVHDLASPAQKYGLIFTATEWLPEDNHDPSGHYAGWIQTVRVAQSMQRAGVPAQNLRLLYYDGQSRCEVPILPAGHCQHLPLIAPATNANLESAFTEYCRILRPKDQLLVHLSSHGERSGILRGDLGETLGASTVSNWLQRVQAQTVVVIDACHAGAFIKRMPRLTNPVIGTALDNELGWVDRHGSFGPAFFPHLRSSQGMSLDAGSVRMAFEHASEQYRWHGRQQRWYIEHRFDGQGLPADQLAQLTFTPVLFIP
jgi:hypothetical protein